MLGDDGVFHRRVIERVYKRSVHLAFVNRLSAGVTIAAA
jgi:hypothetical protein